MTDGRKVDPELPTVKDVAQAAGVSVRTVSYVVSRSGRISSATRDRVQEAIRQLGYLPNPAARHLQSRRTGLVALGVPNLEIPYFAELATTVLKRADEIGLTVLIEQTSGDAEAEERMLDNSESRVDGVILSPLELNASAVAELAGRMPVVLLGEVSGEHLLDHVSIDNVAAGMAATEHLIASGARRIALIGAQAAESSHTARQRERGYRKALIAAGFAIDEDLIVSVDNFHRIDGSRALNRLAKLRHPPDAAVCLNDLLAIGAIRGAHELGIEVPGDIAIIGMDDVEEGRFAIPSLSTIQPSKSLIGEWAVDRLAARINGDDSHPTEHVVPFRLIVRESTARHP